MMCETRVSPLQSGLVYSEEEWQKEWNELLKLASSEPRVNYNNHVNSR